MHAHAYSQLYSHLLLSQKIQTQHTAFIHAKQQNNCKKIIVSNIKVKYDPVVADLGFLKGGFCSAEE